MVSAKNILKKYAISSSVEAYVIGSFESGVTVFNQQVRALNLAYAMVEAGKLPTVSVQSGGAQIRDHKIAIVGGGVSGITFAAALLSKGYAGKIFIFEKRDTIFPLQSGNDTRWLHPRIYDWPASGSESSSAMLPIMNWCAGRASDVVVQLQDEWRKIVESTREKRGNQEWVNLFCNVGHIKITRPNKSKTLVEWIGEQREYDATVPKLFSTKGDAQEFDTVVMAVGFGIEGSDVVSYWRNDQYGQPTLDASKRTFVVSGQGDGAVIDLLRLRISNFRQDRILGDLFPVGSNIVGQLKEIAKLSSEGKHQFMNHFQRLEEKCSDDVERIKEILLRRFRRDVELILQIKKGKLSDLFDSNSCKMSFQNRFLLFFLYRTGGFTPLVLEDENCDECLRKRFAETVPTYIMRRGVKRSQIFTEIFDKDLYEKLEKFKNRAPLQEATARWTGGYFGYFGREIRSNDSNVEDTVKADWRKEYLPAVSEIMASAFCGVIAGYLKSAYNADEQLRVTLHRSLRFGNEELLQQTCEYSSWTVGGPSGAGRTFPSQNATIGLAYSREKIIRSKLGAQPDKIRQDMQALSLLTASRGMRDSVGFLLAIPLLEDQNTFTGPSKVWGVLYIDSAQPDFYVCDEGVRHLCNMMNGFTASLQQVLLTRSGDISNISFGVAAAKPGESARSAIKFDTLEELEKILPPSYGGAFQYNLDYTDYAVGSGA